MSGGPPHHPHNRQVPAANTAWNHLQVPNFFPTRQPQHAHMSNEHPILQHPTWHTPTTEPIKNIQHSHLFNLEQMLSDRPFQRHAPGVDLSVTRNGNQNGDLPITPISLSVRDTNKINSLAASALEIQNNEIKAASPGLKSLSPGLKSLSPGLKSLSPGLKSSSPILKSLSPGLKSLSPGLKCASPGMKPLSPGLKPASPGLKSFGPGLLSSTSPLLITNSGTITANTSITLKPLSPAIISNLKTTSPTLISSTNSIQISLGDRPATSPLTVKKAKRVDSILERLIPQNNEERHHEIDKPLQTVTQSGSHDENSNSSSILNVPTPSAMREEDVVSPYSNEDSLDSNKSRRKRKPSKTVRVPVETDVEFSPAIVNEKETKLEEIELANKLPEDITSTPDSPEPSKKMRRKTSSESETIDKIAAMVQETLKKADEEKLTEESPPEIIQESPQVESAKTTVITVAQKKDFVAVEDKLEEMFAGLEDPKTPPPISVPDFSKEGFNNTEDLLALECTPSTSSHQDNVTSTSGEIGEINSKKSTPKKKRKLTSKDIKKNKSTKTKNIEMKIPKCISSKKVNGKTKSDAIKDVYAYDSGSNASSSKSRGPFVHIRGTRDSPLSVSVINTSVNEEESEKKGVKNKKFHDDSEYRHKVRSKGLHCSTLSNKYDAQTKDTSWICVFCKRGPYSNEFGKLDFYYTPGDLFGPYVIMNNTPEFANRLDDPFDKQFKSKKVSRSLEMVPKIKKSKRKISESVSEDGVKDCNIGIVPTDDHSFEIWAHEDCIVWSPGIYLVGPKILGLEEAVWTCSNVNCTCCNIKGANVCCLKRGCPSVVHLGCAYVSKWHLDEDNYKAYCFEHRTV